MDPFELPLALSTVVTNDIYMLSMINASGGGSCPTFPSLFPRGANVGSVFSPGPTTIVLSLYFTSFLMLGFHSLNGALF